MGKTVLIKPISASSTGSGWLLRSPTDQCVPGRMRNSKPLVSFFKRLWVRYPMEA